MDVSKFQLQGEWLELEVESEKVVELLKFRIKPLSSNEQIDMAEAGKDNVKGFLSKIEELILDWNLKEGENDLPCDKEAKKKYLPYLIGMIIKDQKEAKEETQEKSGIGFNTVGLAIIEFAQDFSNFIKN